MNNQNGENLMRGVIYDKYNYEIFDAVQSVGYQVNAIGSQMKAEMNQMSRKIDLALRKERKSCVSHEVAIANSGEIDLVAYYDDGTREITQFITNEVGPWAVYRLYLDDDRKKIAWGIFFSGTGRWVICSKIKAKNIYEQFVKAGIMFNPILAESTIGKILFETFAPQMLYSDHSMVISGHAGWYRGEFFDRNNFPFRYFEEFENSAVMMKEFTWVQPKDDTWDNYFKEMRNIRSWKERLMVCLFPYAGILASLLQNEGISLGVAINIVLPEYFPGEVICNWFQIFNRRCLVPYNCDTTEREFKEMLYNSKDEVIIADFRTSEYDSDYQSNKMRRMQMKVVEIVTGRKNLPGAEGKRTCVGLVTLSESLCSHNDVYNLIIDNETCTEKYIDHLTVIKEETVDAVFSSFILFVRSGWNNVLKQIKKMRQEKKENNHVIVMSIVIEIVKDFWANEGTDFVKSIGIPSDVNFAKIFCQNCFEADEMVEQFVKVVRKEAGNYYFVKKASRIVSEVAIIYNDEFVWISPKILKEMLERHGMLKYLKSLLLQLKERGVLKTDTEGLTRKLQVAGRRKEYYQFYLSTFNPIGLPDITSLGKEMK